jgi:putative PIN family toxin of toxin-antitoxin system
VSRVLIDTNVIISALLFPGSLPAAALDRALSRDQVVLSQWILDELHEVVGRKRPDLLPVLDAFLAEIDFELVSPGRSVVRIADPDDQPILDAALSNDVDVIVTGDKHFLSLRCSHQDRQ